jgi:hypothetical protein
MAMGNVCDDPDSPIYNNSGVSWQSGCENAGTSGFQTSIKPLKESSFWTQSIVQCFLKKNTFRKLDPFSSSGKMKVVPTLLGPLQSHQAPFKISQKDILPIQQEEESQCSQKKYEEIAVPKDSPFKIPGISKLCTRGQRKPLKKVQRPVRNSENEHGLDCESSERNCIYCEQILSNSMPSEGWVECSSEDNCAHDARAGAEEEDYQIQLSCVTISSKTGWHLCTTVRCTSSPLLSYSTLQ